VERRKRRTPSKTGDARGGSRKVQEGLLKTVVVGKKRKMQRCRMGLPLHNSWFVGKGVKNHPGGERPKKKRAGHKEKSVIELDGVAAGTAYLAGIRTV